MGIAMGTAWGLHGDCMGTVLRSPHATNIGQIQSRLQIYRELSHGDCTRLLIYPLVRSSSSLSFKKTINVSFFTTAFFNLCYITGRLDTTNAYTSIVQPLSSRLLAPISTSSLVLSMSSSIDNINSSNNNNMDDPYIWLEEVESEQSLQFATEANTKWLSSLGDPKSSNTNTYNKNIFRRMMIRTIIQF